MWLAPFLFVVATLLCAVWFARKWMNPGWNGLLPPGSMGIPFLGETIQILIPSYSLETHPFITKRVQRYGPIFRTSLAGRHVVVSTDPEFNNYIIHQEGISVELWYMNTFSKLFSMEGESKLNGVGEVHKYIRGILLSQFGHTAMKRMLPEMQTVVRKSLERWSTQPSVNIKEAAATMMFELSTTHLFSGYQFEDPPEIMSKRFSKIFQGLMAFPLNVPGATFHECIKEHRKLTNILQGILNDRIRSGNSARRRDILDEIIDGAKTKEFMTGDAVIQLMFVSLFASFESVSIAIALLIAMISGNEQVVKDLRDENASMIESREEGDSCISWEQFKSLNFTNQVIRETLRLANVVPGILRRAVKDLNVKGMMIPAGWTIMLVNSTVHMNPDIFADPLEFNPWRWKEIDSRTASSHFMPFGGGMRQCVGADYTRVVMAMFLHVLVTDFRWTKIKGGDLYRSPILGFKDGLHVKFIKVSDESESPGGDIANRTRI